MINYENFSILTALSIGLLGNFHCVGMCSGIITILSLSLSKENKKKINIYQIYYNIGRLIGYILINIIAFSIGIIIIKTLNINNLIFLKLISGITLIMIALYTLNILNSVKQIEKLGFKIWNNIQKHIKSFLPIKNPIQAIIIGIIWSHVPCGLVYSTVLWSISSGSIIKSIIFIFFFGLGTLPSMISIGLLPNKIKIINLKELKLVIGTTLFILGIYNIYIYLTSNNCH